MTAEEMREIMHGSMRNKFMFYKAHLTFVCGVLNKSIDNAARIGDGSVCIKKDYAFAKKYYAHMARLYESKGFAVSYSIQTESGNCFNVYWDMTTITKKELDRFMNSEYHTDVRTKYLGFESLESIKRTRSRLVSILQDLRFGTHTAVLRTSDERWVETACSCLGQVIDYMEDGKRMMFNNPCVIESNGKETQDEHKD